MFFGSTNLLKITNVLKISEGNYLMFRNRNILQNVVLQRRKQMFERDFYNVTKWKYLLHNKINVLV